jgi:hypothetical protein
MKETDFLSSVASYFTDRLVLCYDIDTLMRDFSDIFPRRMPAQK